VSLDENKGLIGQLTYDFNTAWSPPEPVIRAMQREFPTLKITLRYEEGMAFMGGIRADGSGFDAEYPDYPDEDDPNYDTLLERYNAAIEDHMEGG
jgi:hypothetical protein